MDTIVYYESDNLMSDYLHINFHVKGRKASSLHPQLTAQPLQGVLIKELETKNVENSNLSVRSTPDLCPFQQRKLWSTHPKKGGNLGQPVIDFQGDITRCDPGIWWNFGT